MGERRVKLSLQALGTLADSDEEARDREREEDLPGRRSHHAEPFEGLRQPAAGEKAHPE